MSRLAAPVLACALVLVACTGGGDSSSPTTIVRRTTTSTTEQAVTTTTVPDRRAFAFVAGALSDNTAESLEGAAAFVTADSPAAMYLAHRAAIASLGDARPRAVTTLSEERYTMCGDQTGCVTLSAPHIGADGRLFDFALDGVRVADLVAAPLAPIEIGALDVTLVSAYLRPDDRLVVVYDVVNRGEDPVQVAAFSARYDHPRLGSIDTISYAGGGRLEAGRSARSVAAFDGALLGGSLTVAGADSAWQTPWQAVLPISPRP